MKKYIAISIMLVFLTLVSSAFAIDQSGRIAVGGYGGYSFGFGDVFKKYEEGDFSYQNKAGFCYGGKIKYGLTPNLALVGAVDYQAVKFVTEGYGDIFWDVLATEDWHWTGILLNLVCVISPEAKSSPYLTAGAGYYFPNEDDGKSGFNAGLGMEHFFQDNLAVDVGARIHVIFTEVMNTTYLQTYIGLNFYLGGK
jgi:hypothetical protein